MVVYGEGRYRCPYHGIVRPGPRAAEELDAGHFEPPCPVCERPLEAEAVPEDAPLDPRNVYAATKVAQEHLCASYSRETGAAVTALRYHNVYGPRMPRDTPYAGVASIFRSALEAGRTPRVFEDGEQRRDFVHVRDVARANVLALQAGVPGAFNVASGTPRSVGEMAADAHARRADRGHRRVARGRCAACVRLSRSRRGRARVPRERGLRRRHGRVPLRAAARMTRFAVVGHVEWIEFGRFTHVPEPGEIIDAAEWFSEAAGSAAVVAVQLAKLSGDVDFFTALGEDERGRRARARLQELGVRVHAAPRDAMQRWGFVHLTDDGERTISIVGERHAPVGDDDLPWERLDGCDAVFVSGGDAAAMRQAPGARSCWSPRRAPSNRWTASASTRSSVPARTSSNRSTPTRSTWISSSPPRARRAAPGRRVSNAGGRSSPPSCRARSLTSTARATRSPAGVTYGLGAGLSIDDTLAFAARAGAANLTGRGPYEGQLTGPVTPG